MAKKTDDKTLQLIAEVKKRKEEIAKVEKPNWITNCSFAFEEGSSRTTNLHVCSDVRQMIRIAAFLKGQEAAYTDAAKSLGVEEVPDFTWDGFSVADWLADIKTRIAKVQIKKKKESLEALEKRLDKIISPELRAELELEAIAAELG